jgi:hypothetical protein
MCFIAVCYRALPEFPLVVAANRDEFLDRPGRPPAELAPGVWGGSDPRSGGTWLGVNSRGLLAAVANVLTGSPLDPRARSRGLLCLDVLGLKGSESFPDFLRAQVRASAFNPFNLVAADASGGWIASFVGDELAIRPMVPGLHVIANSPPEDPGSAGPIADPKVAVGRRLISISPSLDETVLSLQAACRYHGSGAPRAGAICVHGRSHGTLSSTILAVHEQFPRASRYWFADGPPCTSPYGDVSGVLAGAKRGRGAASCDAASGSHGKTRGGDIE